MMAPTLADVGPAFAPTTADDLDALLPVLDERPLGAVLDRTTGEMLDLDDPAAVRRACGAVIDAYALAATKADALRLAIEAKRAPLVKAAMDTVEDELANDWDYQAQRVELAQATAARDAILDGLGGALQGRTGDHAISLDAGSALVTWGKARETWTLSRPASWFGAPAARARFARLMSIFIPDDKLAEAAAASIIDELGPVAKLSDLPPVRVTLRGER